MNINKFRYIGRLVKTKTDIRLAVALSVICIAVFYQVRNHEFISLDDPAYVVHNAHVFTGLRGERVLSELPQRLSYTGPSASYMVVQVRDRDEVLHMESWHELFEQHGTSVAKSTGISPLGDQTREEVLSAEPEDYRRFRHIWKTIRTRSQELIPPQGSLHDGAVRIPPEYTRRVSRSG